MGGCCPTFKPPVYESLPKAEHFTVHVEPIKPSAVLRWHPAAPEDLGGEILAYEVGFKKLGVSQFIFREVPSDQGTECTLRTEDGLEPLTNMQFQVRAALHGRFGEWSSENVFIDWHCRYPTCGKNRIRKYDGQIYDFCSRTCAKSYCSRHCMHPSCVHLKGDQDCYCTEHSTEDGAFVLELEANDDKFKSVQKKFKKAWSSDKGSAPKISFIFKIINPQTARHFEAYVGSLPKPYHKPSLLYYGTRLHCDLANFPELCRNSNCGVCSLSRGKGQQLQKDENGLCFSTNPSRSHDLTSSVNQYRAVVACKVAAGSKGKGGDSIQEGSRTPPSPDRRQKGDILVRNIDAVCPQYIIVYTYP